MNNIADFIIFALFRENAVILQLDVLLYDTNALYKTYIIK